MKKGFFLVLVVAVAAFFLHGCQSTGPSSKKSGYPVGHDLHPNNNDDQKNDPHPLPGFSSTTRAQKTKTAS